MSYCLRFTQPPNRLRAGTVPTAANKVTYPLLYEKLYPIPAAVKERVLLAFLDL
ncbi:MAG: hypothetical protein L5656_09930 [Thermanaeromonas sp.]|nr:hypothetical protein [Thermanaeromonas sp.]